jgi:hypothetical protein
MSSLSITAPECHLTSIAREQVGHCVRTFRKWTILLIRTNSSHLCSLVADITFGSSAINDIDRYSNLLGKMFQRYFAGQKTINAMYVPEDSRFVSGEIQ